MDSNFSKYEIDIKGTDTLTVGIALHDNKGKITLSDNKAWFNYLTPHHGTELSSTIVINPKYYAGHQTVISEGKDKNHLLVHLKVIDNKVEYFSGFN